MSNLKSILLLVVLFFSALPVFAQQPSCAASEANAWQAAHDPAYAQSLQRQLQSWANYNLQSAGMPQGLVITTSSGTVYEVPIVFHIIHTGQAVGTAQNPSDATIQSLVSYLNSVYAATWAAFPDTNNGGVYVPIRFVLAKRSPTCQATTGINRVNGSSVTNYSTNGIGTSGSTTGADEVAVKNLSRWPNTAYLNIWIVTNIQGAAANGGAIAGYAYFPGVAANIDGVVLRYDQTNWAIAHEVGHTMGLRHTFEGSSNSTTCPTNNNCSTDGDLVCDTDPHALVSGCPTGTNPCTGTSYVPVVYNIMNYSSCPNRFTQGQKTRMIYQLINYRSSLLTSLGGTVPGTYPSNIAAPPTACVPSSITNAGNPYDIGPNNISFSDISYHSGGYTTDDTFYADHTVNACTQGQIVGHVTVGSSYPLSVSVGTSNAENTYAWIDWNNDGIFQTTEKVMGVSNTAAGQTATTNVTVPATAVTCLPLRMRVFSDFSGSTTPSACGNPVYGQVEDFTVMVQPVTTVPTVSITASANPVCTGTSVSFNATITNVNSSGGMYQWYVNGNAISGATYSPYTYTPANGDVVTGVFTYYTSCSATQTVTSNAITMAVNTTSAPTVSIAASQNNICSGTSVTFTATPSNGGTIPAYQWKVNGTSVTGATSSTYTFTPANGSIVTCVLTSSSSCASPSAATSNAVTMNVSTPSAPSVSITAGANNICAGTSVTFTATPTNGGSGPGYQWYKNGVAISGATYSPYTYAPANGDVVTCIMTSNAACVSPATATSNAVTMAVNANVTPAVSIAASQNNICTGTAVTFTATPTNGGTAPAYQWKVNATAVTGATNSTYTFSPANGNIVTCVLTSNATCVSPATATSNSVSMVVNAAVTPSVSITATANPVCAGTSVTFTATASGGGSAPAYQWRVNSVTVTGATNSTYTYAPATGDIVTCVLTSNSACATTTTATSNAVTMTVNPVVTPSVTVTASNSSVCAGTSVTFTATPVNGGTAPAYQWKVNSTAVTGATNSTYTYIPANGDQVTCTLTSNAACAATTAANSNTVTMTVTPVVTPAVSISASAVSTCSGTSVTCTAIPTNGGTIPAYQWKINGNAITGATNSTYTFIPANGNTVNCVLTSNASCTTTATATSNTITMTVTPTVVSSVTITTSSNNICAGTSATFTAVPVNGGTAPVYQWKVNGSNAGSNSTTYTYIPANGDVVTCVLTGNAPCSSPANTTSNSIIMNVSPQVTPSVIITASADSVCTGTSVTFTAAAANGGTIQTYQWKVNGSNAGTNSATYTYTPANGDLVTCVMTGNPACATTNTATSNGIAITVKAYVTPSIQIGASSANICSGNTVSFGALPTNGGTAPAYQWKVNGSSVGTSSTFYSYVPVNGDVVSCVMTSNAFCVTAASVSSNNLSIVVHPTFVPSISVSAVPGTNVISGQNVTFTANVTNPGSVYAVSWMKNNVPVPGANSTVWTAVAGTDFQNNDVITGVLHCADACASPDSVAESHTMVVRAVGIATVSVPEGFRLYPNPAETSVIIMEGLHKGDKAILRDVTGKVIDTHISAGDTKETWHLAEMASGVYFVECRRADDSTRWEVKLIRR